MTTEKDIQREGMMNGNAWSVVFLFSIFVGIPTCWVGLFYLDRYLTLKLNQMRQGRCWNGCCSDIACAIRSPQPEDKETDNA